MTNGYKGENITKLLAPFKTIPYENFSQLVDHDFTFISHYTQIESPKLGVVSDVTLETFRLLMTGMMNWNVNFSPPWKKPLQRILKQSRQLKEGERELLFGFYGDRAREDFAKCERTAYVGWTKETSQLYEVISLKFPEFKDEKLYIGKD